MHLEKTFSGKNILVLGGGISGNSAAKLLLELGATVSLCDKILPNPLPKYYTRGFADNENPGKILQNIDLVVKSPGINPHHPVLAASKETISEIALGRMFYQGKLIGVTGTDGKSTTATLIHHFLRQNMDVRLGGNIGNPFTSFCREDFDAAVLELSSYQLEDSRDLDISIAVFLNIAPDHLERHGDMQQYMLAKKRILSQNPGQTLVTAKKLLPLLQLQDYPGKVLVFGESGCDAEITENSIATKNFCYDTGSFQPEGRHNRENLAAAILAAESAGCEAKTIQQAIASFSGLPHRFEFAGKINHTLFINDSKSTNLHSLLSWLENHPQDKKLVLLLGGQDKGEDISRLGEILANKNCRVFLYGQAREKWKKDLARVCPEEKENLEQVFAALPEMLQDYQPDHVVLSPACASFDQYKNFEERGDHFKRLVQNLSVD